MSRSADDRPRSAKVGVLLGVCLWAAGCGMADYERHVDEQRARVSAFDEENRFLGDPLEMPPPTDLKARESDLGALNLFLRPPRGVETRPSVPAYGLHGPLLHRYPSVSGASVLLAGRAPEPAREDKAGDPVKLSKAFRDDVRAALVEFCKAEYKKNLDWPPAPLARVEVNRALPGAEEPRPNRFDKASYPNDRDAAAPWHFDLYFYQRGGGHLCVIYQVPQASAIDQKTARAVELSLASLDTGQEGARKRAAYAARKRGK